MKEALAATVAACCLLFGACSGGNDTPAQSTRRQTLVVNDSPSDICVAVASTVAERNAGLSFRRSIPPKEGMAFLYAEVANRLFTMRDTPIPLSIVWVAPDGKVLGATPLTPNDVVPKPSPAPISMAIELSPQDWSPIAATARTISLGEHCDGTLTAGRPGVKPSKF